MLAVDMEEVSEGEDGRCFTMLGGRGRRAGMGLGGKCICPECGYNQPHQRGVSCNSMKCPKCGVMMVREG